jgi:GTPase-associated protein 1, N-terminal domain type 2/GTPase-associated protein 1, middle domain
VTQELLYTSAAQGLNPGSRGFCTVVRTRGMSAPLAAMLESLSGYRPAFPLNDPRASQNPVNYSHVRAAVGGKTLSIVSRVADYGLDYSQRTNKIAHHVVLAPDERPEAGPAWLLAQPGFMDARWDGQPRTLPTGRRVPQGTERPTLCPTWAALTGDAGWAGVLAESWLAGTPCYLIFEPGTDTLGLIREAVALLPPRKRWEATFATYFTGIPSGIACNCRCVVDGSQEAVQALRLPHVLSIPFNRKLPRASGGALVEAARVGSSQAAAVGNSAQGGTPSKSHPPSLPQSASISSGGGTGSGSRSHSDSSASYALRKTAEPPPMRVRQVTPGEVDPQGRRRRWIWWLSGSLAVGLLTGAAILLAVWLPRLKPEGNPSAIQEKKGEAVAEQKARVEKGTGLAKKDSEPQPAARDTKKKPGTEGKEEPPTKGSPASSPDPKKAVANRQADAKTNVGPPAITQKSSVASAQPKLIARKPTPVSFRPYWPDFLAKNDAGRQVEGPMEMDGLVAGKRYSLAIWLPVGNESLRPNPREPSQSVEVHVQAQMDVVSATFSASSETAPLKLRVQAERADLGESRYCALELVRTDDSASSNLIQLFPPRSAPIASRKDAATRNSQWFTVAEWLLPAPLERSYLPAMRSDFLCLGDGERTLRFVSEPSKGGGRAAFVQLVPAEPDYDFFADQPAGTSAQSSKSEVPKLFLRYIGIEDNGPADAIAATHYRFAKSLQSGESRLLALADRALREKQTRLERVRNSLHKEKKELVKILGDPKDPKDRAYTRSKIQELDTFEARLNRWDEIKRILAKPQIVAASVYYEVARRGNRRKIKLVDFQKAAVEAHK